MRNAPDQGAFCNVTIFSLANGRRMMQYPAIFLKDLSLVDKATHNSEFNAIQMYLADPRSKGPGRISGQRSVVNLRRCLESGTSLAPAAPCPSTSAPFTSRTNGPDILPHILGVVEVGLFGEADLELTGAVAWAGSGLDEVVYELRVPSQVLRLGRLQPQIGATTSVILRGTQPGSHELSRKRGKLSTDFDGDLIYTLTHTAIGSRGCFVHRTAV